MGDTITIYIPYLPDRRLGPNKSRYQHWGTTTRLQDELKSVTWGAVREACQRFRAETGHPWRICTQADMHIEVVNARRSMDSDNAEASLKHARDQLEGIIIVNDSGLNVTGPKFIRDRNRRTGTYFKIADRADQPVTKQSGSAPLPGDRRGTDHKSR